MIVPATSPNETRSRSARAARRCRRPAGTGAPARSGCPRSPARGRRSCRRRTGRPGRTLVPLTVAWASCCGNVQYSPRAFVREITSPLSSTSSAMSSAQSPVGLEVVERRRVLRRGGHPERLERGERHDPGRDRGGERLPQERAERLVLPALDVARAPVVDEHEAEHVVGRLGGRDARAERVAGAGDEPELELDVEPLRSARTWARPRSGAGRAGGGSACRRPRPSSRGRGSRPAGGASWAAAARSSGRNRRPRFVACSSDE